MTHFRLLLNGVSLPKDYVSLRKDSHLSKEGRNSSSSLKRTWFFVSWLAKHIRNPIRIDLNRRTGRTWTVDSFLSSRMHWSSFTSLFGVKIPQSPRKYLRLQHLNPGIRRTWDSDCFLSARLPWSSFFSLFEVKIP